MPTTVEQMTAMANSLLDVEKKVKDAEIELRDLNKKAQFLREETIPAAMQEAGVTVMKLTTGQTITIGQEVYASIPMDMRVKAFGWLEEHNFGDLIKSNVLCNFARGDLEKAGELVEHLQSRGLEPEFKESVHPQTLKAFLKEQIAKGTNIPLDVFGARPVWRARIK